MTAITVTYSIQLPGTFDFAEPSRWNFFVEFLSKSRLLSCRSHHIIPECPALLDPRLFAVFAVLSTFLSIKIMSGGRGRGRGGFKPPTGAQLLMQRSAQESGLDEKNLRSLQDLTRPALFPDLLWHSSGQVFKAEDESQVMVPTKLTQSAIYLIRKGRDIQHRMQTSPFYLRPAQEVDVIRYRKRPRQQLEASDKNVIEHLGKVATCRFVPDELLQPSIRAAAALAEAQRRNALLDDPIDIKGEPGEGGESEEEDMDGLEAPDEEEDDVEDYTTNYYASDDESDGGDDEPTF